MNLHLGSPELRISSYEIEKKKKRDNVKAYQKKKKMKKKGKKKTLFAFLNSFSSVWIEINNVWSEVQLHFDKLTIHIKGWTQNVQSVVDEKHPFAVHIVNKKYTESH